MTSVSSLHQFDQAVIVAGRGQNGLDTLKRGPGGFGQRRVDQGLDCGDGPGRIALHQSNKRLVQSPWVGLPDVVLFQRLQEFKGRVPVLQLVVYVKEFRLDREVFRSCLPPRVQRIAGLAPTAIANLQTQHQLGQTRIFGAIHGLLVQIGEH